MSRKVKLQWIASLHVEFANMHDKDVWRIVKRTTVPPGKNIIGNRWVYALKDIVLVQSDRVLVKFLVRIFRKIMPL
jgi:hypothetical protein